MLLVTVRPQKDNASVSYRDPIVPPTAAPTTSRMASAIASIHRFRLHQGRFDGGGDGSGGAGVAMGSGMLEVATSGAPCSLGLSPGVSAHAYVPSCFQSNGPETSGNVPLSTGTTCSPEWSDCSAPAPAPLCLCSIAK